MIIFTDSQRDTMGTKLYRTVKHAIAIQLIAEFIHYVFVSSYMQETTLRAKQKQIQLNHQAFCNQFFKTNLM